MANGKINCIRFLEKNGFTVTDTNSYSNEYCNVVFDDTGQSMTIADNEGNEHFSVPNIYLLIGFLTYYNWISRNYKI